MFSPQGLREVFHSLPPECLTFGDRKDPEYEPLFADFARQEVWEAIYRLARAGSPVDMTLVGAELDRVGRYRTIGGAAFLAGLAEEFVSTVFISAYAKIVFDCWKARLKGRLSALYAKAQTKDPQDGLRLLERIREVETISFDPPRMGMTDQLAEFLTEMESARHRTDSPGILTGIGALDRLTGGMRPQELWVIGGRTSMGKSCFLIQIAYHAARAGVPVWFLTLEMSATAVVQRMTSLHTGVPLGMIRDPRGMTDQIADRLHDANQQLGRMPMTIVDKKMTADGCKHAALQAVKQHKVGLIVVDYLQTLLMPKGLKWSRYELVTNASGTLQALAKEANIPVLTAAQVGRDVMNRLGKKRQRGDAIPTLVDFRESGAIEQDADVVMGFHRHGNEQPPRLDLEDPTIPDEVMCSLLKQRNGTQGAWSMIWDGAHATFRNLARDRSA